MGRRGRGEKTKSSKQKEQIKIERFERACTVKDHEPKRNKQTSKTTLSNLWEPTATLRMMKMVRHNLSKLHKYQRLPGS